MILVSLRDLKALTWTQPHAVNNKAAAIREFEQLVNDSQPTLVSQHPSDFDLFEIGSWDADTGSIVGFTSSDFVKLANGNEVKRENT